MAEFIFGTILVFILFVFIIFLLVIVAGALADSIINGDIDEDEY